MASNMGVVEEKHAGNILTRANLGKILPIIRCGKLWGLILADFNQTGIFLLSGIYLIMEQRQLKMYHSFFFINRNYMRWD